MKNNPLFALFLIIIVSSSSAGAPIKIMPVGNSITAGEHYGKPANAERTGYRKDLYWMLINTGYDVDFVGSQTHGKRPDDDSDWYDWNCEAYPGWQITNITNKVKSALPEYKPDILLVHVGTNGESWNSKPGQVMDMLDMINDFSVENNHPMTVFLCKIINRFKGGHAPTTQFNNNVADSVAGRAGDAIKILMVDMENGAGLDYSDAPPDQNANPPYEGGDMWGTKYPGVSYDLFHPNDKGNTKMAVAFYQELVKELEEPSKIKGPEINQQPQQFELYQNYPNPFNPSTTIKFEIAEISRVKLGIYNIDGQEIAVLVNDFRNAGTYSVLFDGSNLPSGVYSTRLESNGYNTTNRMLLLK